jgi:antitoxin ParD1/3/4
MAILSDPYKGLPRCILQKRKGGKISAMGVRMATTQNTLVVDLGSLRQRVEEPIKAGSYASADEVVRVGLLALEREEASTHEWLTKLAEESLADPRPSVPAAQVFQELRAIHREAIENADRSKED